jgi:hypothetical protein
VTRAVGEESPRGYPVNSWSAVENPPLGLWLSEVKHDLETPNLWTQLRQDQETLTTATSEDAENTPFTAAEQAEIANQLREIKEYVTKTYDLSAGQMHVLETRLDSIRDAASRLGRRDWLTWVAGTLTILQAVLPPGAIRHILLMTLRSAAHLLGHPIPELPSGN